MRCNHGSRWHRFINGGCRPDPSGGRTTALVPDQETYVREEQRRFEILDAHWELPVKAVDLEGK